MTSSGRRQLMESICDAALALPPGERDTYVSTACGGDAALKAEVESLLAHASSSEHFLSAPVAAVAAAVLASSSVESRRYNSADLALAPGTRLGAYEIRAPLGKGGMGEVYLAHDSGLKRDVALKVLPDDLARSPDRLARFRREAEILASLNHPNIAQIHRLEESDGRIALVMELVEGEDLSDRIALGAIPLVETLRIAAQIASALEAAHDRGIVHRDLKPANVKVRADGTAKVLDFGLAKSWSLAGVKVPTATITPMTMPGAIVGTSAYMSPEQARGEQTGPETDIWAFGVVLYEMLTGISPFLRPTTAETLAQVLAASSDESRLPPETPASVRRLVRRCLEGDARRRWRHIGDVRIAIEEALATPTDSTTAPAAAGRSWPFIAAATVIALLTGAGGWWLASRVESTARGEVMRLSIPSMGAPEMTPYGTRHLAISKDGSRLAYAAATGLLVRHIDQQELVGVGQGAINPFFSPDGQWLAFFNARTTTLMKVPVSGGAVTLISPTTDRPGGGTWGEDGTIVFATSEGLYRISQDGGPATLLARPDAAQHERGFAWPEFMPGGRSVLFTILSDGPIEGAQIALLDLRTRQRQIVLKGGTAAHYTSHGDLVFAAGPRLNAVTFDPVSGRLGGDPVSAADVSLANTPDNGAAEFAISDNGTLIFTSSTVNPSWEQTVYWTDREGHEEPLPLGPGPYAYPRVSPDGTLVALDVTGANRDVWIWNLARKTLTRLTDGPNEDNLPMWSVDGRRVFFSSNRTDNIDIYSQAADGSSPARRELAAPGSQFANGITPDGTRLIVYDDFKDLSLLDLSHPDRLQPLLHTDFDERLGVISPDGHWIAYESNEASERFDIFIRPFPNVTDRRERVSIEGGRYPLWGVKGSNELFYVDPNGIMMSAAVTLEPALKLGPVTPLFTTAKPPAGVSSRPYDMSPVDRRFILTRRAPRTATDTVDITVVANWFHQVGQRTSGASR